MGRDESGKSRDESADGWDESAARGAATPRPRPPRATGSPQRLARPHRPRSGDYRPHSPQASPTALNDFATEHGHSFANSRTVASGAGREITNHTQHRPASGYCDRIGSGDHEAR
jgi:hypothetical protein